MKNQKKIIYMLISIFAILFPLGFLIGLLEAKIAFPTIFILLGVQQLYNGFFLVSKENKIHRNISVVMGGFLLIFGFLVVLPHYYL